MLKNYFKTAFRNIYRRKVFSIINITGLAIGIAAVFIIYFFINDELSYDRFHEKKNNLFRINILLESTDGLSVESRSPYVPTPMGPAMLEYFDEVIHMSRLVEGRGVVRNGDVMFRERIQLADAQFLEMFTFPLISGNKGDALKDGNSVVLSENAAKKYFGATEAVGKTINITFGNTSKDFLVTGIAKKIPANSTINFDFLINMHHLPDAINNREILTNWNRNYLQFYVELAPGYKLSVITERSRQFCQQYLDEPIQRYKENHKITNAKSPLLLEFQPITDIYLDTNGKTPSIILSAMTFLILLIACINYMNISIGMSSFRSMEVGIRKVLGARKNQMIVQFWSEAVLISLIAAACGFILTACLLPSIGNIMGKDFSSELLLKLPNLLILLCFAILTGLLAGSYPAFVVSRFQPHQILKNTTKKGGRSFLTKGLVIFQFTVSIILILAAVILRQQADYLINKDLGYKKEGLLVVRTQENEQKASEDVYARFKNMIQSNVNIQSVSASNREFGIFLPGSTMHVNDVDIRYRFNRVDFDFIPTIGLNLIEGRNFSKHSSASENAVIINKKLASLLGDSFRVGGTIGDVTKDFPLNCRVVGIIDDSHYLALRSEIAPLLLFSGNGPAPRRAVFSRMFIRFDTKKTRETLSLLEASWKKVNPNKPFVYDFLDETLARQYTREMQWRSILGYASILSIIIAGMGIFGLSTLLLTKRIREISIRKVFGASPFQLLGLVVKDFLILVGIANLIAWPIGYFISIKMLQEYPYKININIKYFVLTGLATVIVALLSIIYVSMKAAYTNPTKNLKTE